MPPVPKRRHSAERKGKRRKSLKLKLPATKRCPNCQSLKETHQICPTCGQYS